MGICITGLALIQIYKILDCKVWYRNCKKNREKTFQDISFLKFTIGTPEYTQSIYDDER